MRKFLFTLGTALVLTACAPMHTAPQSGPSATVTFIAKDKYAFNVFAYYRDNTECLNPQKIGSFGQPSGVILRSLSEGRERLTTRIAADKPAVLQMQLHQQAVWLHQTCTVTLEFLPSAAQTYEVPFNLDSRQCWANVDRVTGGDRVREATARPSAKQCDAVLEF